MIFLITEDCKALKTQVVDTSTTNTKRKKQKTALKCKRKREMIVDDDSDTPISELSKRNVSNDVEDKVEIGLNGVEVIENGFKCLDTADTGKNWFYYFVYYVLMFSYINRSVTGL